MSTHIVHTLKVNANSDGSGGETGVRVVGFVDQGNALVSLQVEDNDHLWGDDMVPDPDPLPDNWVSNTFSADEARQLAHALLWAADEAEEAY